LVLENIHKGFFDAPIPEHLVASASAQGMVLCACTFILFHAEPHGANPGQLIEGVFHCFGDVGQVLKFSFVAFEARIDELKEQIMDLLVI